MGGQWRRGLWSPREVPADDINKVNKVSGVLSVDCGVDYADFFWVFSVGWVNGQRKFFVNHTHVFESIKINDAFFTLFSAN